MENAVFLPLSAFSINFPAKISVFKKHHPERVRSYSNISAIYKTPPRTGDGQKLRLPVQPQDKFSYQTLINCSGERLDNNLLWILEPEVNDIHCLEK